MKSLKKLALTTTITVINALQTNSWFGQLLQMVLNASGVKYSMAQNGYICLGSFGSLIIQWGTETIINNSGIAVTMPLAYADTTYKILITHNNGVLSSSVVPLSVGYINPTYFYVSNNIGENPNFFWVTIGR